jgi:hypothetical protein
MSSEKYPTISRFQQDYLKLYDYHQTTTDQESFCVIVCRGDQSDQKFICFKEFATHRTTQLNQGESLDDIKEEIRNNMSSILTHGSKSIYNGWDSQQWRFMLREMMDQLDDHTTVLEILWGEFGSSNRLDDFHEFLHYLDWEKVNLYEILANPRNNLRCQSSHDLANALDTQEVWGLIMFPNDHSREIRI